PANGAFSPFRRGRERRLHARVSHVSARSAPVPWTSVHAVRGPVWAPRHANREFVVLRRTKSGFAWRRVGGRGRARHVLAATAAAGLALSAPVVVHDADERSPLANAAAHAPTSRDTTDRRPAVYGRAVPARAGGEWLQYWLYYAYQDQDRGIVRSGRHEGDW